MPPPDLFSKGLRARGSPPSYLRENTLRGSLGLPLSGSMSMSGDIINKNPIKILLGGITLSGIVIYPLLERITLTGRWFANIDLGGQSQDAHLTIDNKVLKNFDGDSTFNGNLNNKASSIENLDGQLTQSGGLLNSARTRLSRIIPSITGAVTSETVFKILVSGVLTASGNINDFVSSIRRSLSGAIPTITGGLETTKTIVLSSGLSGIFSTLRLRGTNRNKAQRELSGTFSLSNIRGTLSESISRLSFTYVGFLGSTSLTRLKVNKPLDNPVGMLLTRNNFARRITRDFEGDFRIGGTVSFIKDRTLMFLMGAVGIAGNVTKRRDIILSNTFSNITGISNVFPKVNLSGIFSTNRLRASIRKVASIPNILSGAFVTENITKFEAVDINRPFNQGKIIAFNIPFKFEVGKRESGILRPDGQETTGIAHYVRAIINSWDGYSSSLILTAKKRLLNINPANRIRGIVSGFRRGLTQEIPPAVMLPRGSRTKEIGNIRLDGTLVSPDGNIESQTVGKRIALPNVITMNGIVNFTSNALLIFTGFINNFGTNRLRTSNVTTTINSQPPSSLIAGNINNAVSVAFNGIQSSSSTLINRAKNILSGTLSYLGNVAPRHESLLILVGVLRPIGTVRRDVSVLIVERTLPAIQSILATPSRILTVNLAGIFAPNRLVGNIQSKKVTLVQFIQNLVPSGQFFTIHESILVLGGNIGIAGEITRRGAEQVALGFLIYSSNLVSKSASLSPLRLRGFFNSSRLRGNFPPKKAINRLVGSVGPVGQFFTISRPILMFNRTLDYTGSIVRNRLTKPLSGTITSTSTDFARKLNIFLGGTFTQSRLRGVIIQSNIRIPEFITGILRPLGNISFSHSSNLIFNRSLGFGGSIRRDLTTSISRNFPAIQSELLIPLRRTQLIINSALVKTGNLATRRDSLLSFVGNIGINAPDATKRVIKDTIVSTQGMGGVIISKIPFILSGVLTPIGVTSGFIARIRTRGRLGLFDISGIIIKHTGQVFSGILTNITGGTQTNTSNTRIFQGTINPIGNRVKNVQRLFVANVITPIHTLNAKISKVFGGLVRPIGISHTILSQGLHISSSILLVGHIIDRKMIKHIISNMVNMFSSSIESSRIRPPRTFNRVLTQGFFSSTLTFNIVDIRLHATIEGTVRKHTTMTGTLSRI